MIHSIFVVNTLGDVVLEKHFRSVIGRNVLDSFVEAQNKAGKPNDVPPCLSAGRSYLINIFRENLFFIAVVQKDLQAVMVLEFLHRICDIFEGYFSSLSERNLTLHATVAAQVLEEMLDNGFPLTTEPNILKEMIRPPGWQDALDSVTGKTGVKETLPLGQLSNTSWRSNGVRYGQNEIFVDVYEYVDTIIDRNGTTISAQIRGAMKVKSRLSGMPDCTLSFMNPRILDDISFHPCVRLARWTNERVMSFVPPDGQFILCDYVFGTQHQIALPLYVKPSITFSGSSGRLDIEIGPKQTMGKQPEDVQLLIPMGKNVNSCSLTASTGTYSFDSLTNTIKWDLKKIPLDRTSTLRGSLHVSSAGAAESTPTCALQFKISGYSASSIKVNRLEIYGEKYKAFKGVKYITEAGSFLVRA